MVRSASFSKTTLLLMATLLSVGGALMYAVGNKIRTHIHHRVQQQLQAVNQELRTALRSYFHEQIHHAQQLVQDPRFKAELTHLSTGRTSDAALRTLLATKTPPAWKDVIVISRTNKLLFSTNKTIENPIDIPALADLAIRIPTILEPMIGECVRMPDNQPLLPFAFPVVDQGNYLATVIVSVDYEAVAKICDLHSKKLPAKAQITVAQEKRGTVSVLFASPNHVVPFETTYIVQDLIPIARACNGDFGVSIEKYENQWFASVRDFSPHFHWALAVQTNLTMLHTFITVIHWLTIMSMGIGLLLVMYLLLASLAMLVAAVKPIMFGLLTVGLFAFLGASYYYMAQYTATQIGLYQSNISQAKIDTQYLASLLLQHSFAIQTVVHKQVLSMHEKKAPQNQFLPQAKNEIQSLKHDFGKSFLGISYFDEQHNLTSAYLSPDHTSGTISDIAFKNFLATSTTPQWVSSLQQKELGSDVYNFYIEPFFDEAQHVKGYVWATLSYNQIKNVLSLLGQQRLLDIIICDTNNTSVFLSNLDWVRNRVNVVAIQKFEAPIVKESFEKAIQGNSLSVDFKNTQGEPWFMQCEFLPNMKWVLGVFTPDVSLHTTSSQLHQFGVLALVFFVCALCCACGLLTQVFTLSQGALQLFSLLYAFLLTIGMSCTIYFNYRYSEKIYTSRAITSRLQSMNLQNELQEKTNAKYIPIKTYVVLDFINISNPNNIHFNALIEQTIDRALYPQVKLGVELANRAGDLTLQEIDRKKEGSLERVIYRAIGTLHQVHQIYSQMPFDMEEIGLWFTPADHINNVLLIPNLEKYSQINPTEKPGVSEQFLLKDYKIRLSYFAYEMVAGQPVLVFTLLTQRNLLSVLLEYFLPLLVILFSIFLITLVSGHIPIEYQLASIAAISGLFFSLIILHQKFRSSLAINQFSYLEASILIVYLGLGYGYLDALYLINKPKALFYKATFYWPAIITYLFSITTLTFM